MKSPFLLTNSIIQETEWILLMRESLVRQLRPRLFRDTNSSFFCCLLNAVWICFVSERGSIIILPRLIVPASTCVWITDVVTDRRQQVRLEKIAASAGSPQGRLLCPPLVSVHLRRLVCSPPDVCSDAATRRLPRLWQKRRDEVLVQKVRQLIKTEW